MKAEVLRLYRATNPQAFAGWETELLALTAEKPTMVIWGDRTPTSPRDMLSGLGLQGSCTCPTWATGLLSRRPMRLRD